MARSSDTPKWQSALIVPEISDKCRYIICSDKEDPMCIRVKYRKDPSNLLYIVAINKCELRFVKCHEYDGYEAILMPMKYCEHTSTKVDLNDNKTNTNKLIKREYIRGKREIAGEVATKSTVEGDGNRKASVDYYSDYEVLDPAGVVAVESSDLSASMSSELDKGVHKQSLSNNGDENTEMPLISQESLATPKARAVDTEKNCPESCPARRVMVCAKCQHGIYRTFSSVCHMRMFSCHHEDEKLELIARYPCVLSAPYISDQNMKPVGKVVDVHDDDEVLKFIRCRSLDKLNGNDPNCQIKDG